MIKKKLQNLFNMFGYQVKRFDKKKLSSNEIIKKNLPQNPIIFDIGANTGQSIDRFTKLCENPEIHSFEPLKKEFEYLKKNYLSKNIFLNNLAVGSKSEIKSFNISVKSDSSSFYRVNKNTKWLKSRSSQFNVSEEDYIKETIPVEVITLDEYISKKDIKKIDLLKIDTECHEDKVLEGATNTLKNIPVNIILLELRFDDVYDKYMSFSDIENLIPKNKYRMVSIDLINNNLFSGLVFAADVMYFNKKKFDI